MTVLADSKMMIVLMPASVALTVLIFTKRFDSDYVNSIKECL